MRVDGLALVSAFPLSPSESILYRQILAWNGERQTLILARRRRMNERADLGEADTGPSSDLACVNGAPCGDPLGEYEPGVGTTTSR